MTEKIYNKLVRDKIPQIILENNGHPIVRFLEPTEFLTLLKTKLIEEAEEVSSASTRAELVDELGDVMELIKMIKQASEISADEVESARLLKLENKGGFKDKIFLEKVIETD